MSFPQVIDVTLGSQGYRAIAVPERIGKVVAAQTGLGQQFVTFQRRSFGTGGQLGFAESLAVFSLPQQCPGTGQPITGFLAVDSDGPANAFQGGIGFSLLEEQIGPLVQSFGIVRFIGQHLIHRGQGVFVVRGFVEVGQFRDLMSWFGGAGRNENCPGQQQTEVFYCVVHKVD